MSPHAREVRAREAHAGLRAAAVDHRLQPGLLRRAVEHGDRVALGESLRADLEAADVRREQHDGLAGGARRLVMREAVDLAQQSEALGARPQPDPGRLEQHLARLGDRRAAQARVAVAGERQVLAQVAAVGGRHPVDRPAEEASQRVQHAQRQARQQLHHLLSLQPFFRRAP